MNGLSNDSLNQLRINFDILHSKVYKKHGDNEFFTESNLRDITDQMDGINLNNIEFYYPTLFSENPQINLTDLESFNIKLLYMLEHRQEFI